MNITHWFRRKVSAATRALTVMMPLPHGFGMKANYESIAREGYMTNSVVFACIQYRPYGNSPKNRSIGYQC